MLNYRGHNLKYLTQINRPVPHETLDEDCIYGVDTESFHSIQLNRLHTAMVQLADDVTEYCYEPSIDESPFHYMMDEPFKRHSEFMKGKISKSRTELQREPGKRGSGRRKIPTVLLCFYNLEYDLSRMFNPDSAFFDLARVNVEGLKVVVDGYEIENVHMILSGSSPHFSWIVRKNNCVLRVMGIDLWGYLKGGLGISAKALGVIDKIEIDKDYFSIPLEELTNAQMDELRTYGKRDPRTTRQLYIQLLKILTDFNPAVVTSKGVLPPSAPGAAVRIMFAGMKEEKMYQSPKWAVKLALDAYNGGLVFARVRGSVRNMLVGDRRSAYPTMMCLLPDPEQIKYVTVWNPKVEDLIGKIGFCRASFRNDSDIIPMVTTFNDTAKSNHAPGHYINQAISIYELAAGYLLGQFKNIKIKQAVYLSYPPEAMKSGFIYDYVQHYFNLKNQNEKGSALYLLAKLMINSPYGKLIEMRSMENLIIPRLVKHLKVPLEWAVKLNKDKKFRLRFYDILLNGGNNIDDFLRKNITGFETDFIEIGDLVRSVDLSAGTYFFPFYASLITGGQRAWMSVYTYYTKAYLADTDSAFTPLGKEEFIEAIRNADVITSRIGVGRCRVGNDLGDVDIELENGHGYIAGIKQYALTDNNGHTKLAHHAITKPLDTTHKEQFYIDTIQSLAMNQQVKYQEKASPVKMRTALMRGRDYGKFESESRTIYPKNDERMELVHMTKDRTYFRWIQKPLQSEDNSESCNPVTDFDISGWL